MCILVFRPPVITGRTTINEGGTLDLVCDASSTIRYATVMWFSPEGVVVSNEMNIVIMNIQRNAAGIYTCEATHAIYETTRNSTVNVTVQRESHDLTFICLERGCVFSHKSPN